VIQTNLAIQAEASLKLPLCVKLTKKAI